MADQAAGVDILPCVYAGEDVNYLERRGLNHPELIETFRLGFGNRTLGYRLPAKNRKAGAELRILLPKGLDVNAYTNVEQSESSCGHGGDRDGSTLRRAT